MFGAAMRPCALLLLCLSVLACGGLDRDVDGLATVKQGVYGQLLTGCDTPNCTPTYLPPRPVGLFTVAPLRDGGVFPAPLAQTTSKDRGFYEFTADAGSYYLAVGQNDAATGVSWFASAAIRVPVGVTRIDWQSGPGGGTFTTVK